MSDITRKWLLQFLTGYGMVEKASNQLNPEVAESGQPFRADIASVHSAHRQIARKISLFEEGNDSIYSQMTAEQRVLMVWQLTLTAWKFANPNGFESRLQRHVTRVERR